MQHVVFSNAEDWKVLEVSVAEEGTLWSSTDDFAETVKVVGVLPGVAAGETVKFTGTWANHPKFGRQFKAKTCIQKMPVTVEGIKAYLSSGLIWGIGSARAELIVDHFGAQTIQVMDNEPERLAEVYGIGPKSAEQIAASWAEQKAVRDVMMWLTEHHITTGLAAKIYQEYGDDSIAVLEEDPYTLTEIRGVGFKLADQVARELGIAHDAPSRVQAGIVFVLEEAQSDGHVYLPEDQLVSQAVEVLGVDEWLVTDAITALENAGRVVCEELEDAGSAVYLIWLHKVETSAAKHLQAMLTVEGSRSPYSPGSDWDFLDEPEPGSSAAFLSPQQRGAVRTALTRKVTVLTGGPGTGKTTTMRAVIAALEAEKASYELAAPTGRAAKQLAEATGREARTIHRLLEYSPRDGFGRHDGFPLDVDMVVIDEASMLDIWLFNHLLKALKPETHLLLVGDVDQLPSVGAGDVLRDIIASERVAVVRLQTIFRQAEGSYIISNSHRINQGKFPTANKGDDFFLFTQKDPTKAAALIVDIVKSRVPEKFGISPAFIQVLAPMHRGDVGVANLNNLLQEALNPPAEGKPEKKFGERVFRVGDKLMQTRNNYDLEVFNGDPLVLVGIDKEKGKLRVQAEDLRVVEYDFGDVAGQLIHAYAISIHKSQGSEFPAVVMPIMTQHYVMLQRNLLYTGVTRAKQVVVLVGQKRAIAMAAKNDQVQHRYSGLRERLVNNGFLGRT